MLAYLGSKLLEGALTLLVVVTVVFVGMSLSGDPVRMVLPPTAGPAEVQQMREMLGLDQSLVIRYIRFLQRLFVGDFGRSIRSREPALIAIVNRLPPTLLLALTSVALAAIVGVPLGVVAALNQGTWLDSVIVVTSTLGQALPVFWLALLLIYAFAVELPVFPTSGYGSPRHLILPMLSLAMFLIGAITRLTRATVISALQEDYVRTARAKGLSEAVVMWKHVLRNVGIPIITQIVLQLRFVVGGSVVVESVFGWPGMGQLLAQAAYARDYPIVVAGTFFVASMIVVANIGLDVLYMLLDPKVKLWGKL